MDMTAAECSSRLTPCAIQKQGGQGKKEGRKGKNRLCTSGFVFKGRKGEERKGELQISLEARNVWHSTSGVMSMPETLHASKLNAMAQLAVRRLHYEPGCYFEVHAAYSNHPRAKRREAEGYLAQLRAHATLALAGSKNTRSKTKEGGMTFTHTHTHTPLRRQTAPHHRAVAPRAAARGGPCCPRSSWTSCARATCTCGPSHTSR
eukprot:1159933-Pelagomonas_calceolata.AAC.3